MTTKNTVFYEDCRKTLKRDLRYHYVITSIPDLSELKYKGKDVWKYEKFLKEVFDLIDPINNVFTVHTTDRKINSVILQKHNLVSDVAKFFGWELLSQKIWIKSYKVNLYRLNYSFLMTFKRWKLPFKVAPTPDVFFVDAKEVYSKDAPSAYPVSVVRTFIEQFTKKGEIVYDPFMGSGATAIAAVNSGRYYIGSEIDKEKTSLVFNHRMKTETLIKKGTV